MLRARAENRPAGSIVDFRRGLHVLARTGPGSGPATGTRADYQPAYRETAYRPVGTAMQQYSPVAVPRAVRRRQAVKRRCDILVGLLVAMGASLVLGLLPGLRVLLAVHVVIDLVFAGYVAALIYMRNLAAEREMKLRFLPSRQTQAEPAFLLRRSAN